MIALLLVSDQRFEQTVTHHRSSLKPQKFQGAPQVTKTFFWNINGVTVHRLLQNGLATKVAIHCHVSETSHYENTVRTVVQKASSVTKQPPSASLSGYILTIMYTTAQSINIFLQ
jgi:hypothetical protein